MKLLILTQYFYPEMGAAASRLLELSRGLQHRGWDIKVLSAMPNYPTGKIFPKYRKKWRVKENIFGIDIQRFWIFASNSSRVFPRIINMLSFAFSSLFSLFYIRKEKPDFILVESPPLVLGLTGLFLSRFSGAKMILNVADIWPLSALELNAISDGFLYRKIVQLEKYIYKKSDICLGQSEEITRHLKLNGARNSHLFRNGVVFSRFEQFNNHNPRKNSKLIYAGLVGVAQGLLSLCRNIDLSKLGIELHIFGEGAERKELQAYLSSNPDKNIFIHEPVERDMIPELLSNYDGAVIPLVKNIYGAVPSKIYESMAAGIPILFSGNGEGASIISKLKVGWVSKPGDYDSFRENLSQFSFEPEKSEEFGRNGRKAAKEMFDRELQIDKLHEYLTDFSKG